MTTHSKKTEEIPLLKVLLIEDDKDLSALVKEYLDLEGIGCDIEETGTSGLRRATDPDGLPYDCIVLDLNLPLLDGISVCRNLRKNKIETPIIMLTARDKLGDKLTGFGAGTNDYLCKPFEMEELIARIRALARRKITGEDLACGDLVMDLSEKTVRRGTRDIQLTTIEFRILKLLLARSPQTLDKRQITNEIWGDEPPDSDSLKVHIHKLRKAIDAPGERQLLQTIAGRGYAIKDAGLWSARDCS